MFSGETAAGPAAGEHAGSVRGTAGAAAGGHLQATQPLLPPGRQQHFLSHFGHKYFKLIFQILVRSVVQLWKNIKLKLKSTTSF